MAIVVLDAQPQIAERNVRGDLVEPSLGFRLGLPWGTQLDVFTLMKHLGLFEKHNQQKVDPVSEFLSAIHDGGSRLPLKPPEQF